MTLGINDLPIKNKKTNKQNCFSIKDLKKSRCHCSLGPAMAKTVCHQHHAASYPFWKPVRPWPKVVTRVPPYQIRG